tara:strand:+ start:93 stop:1193 length:1101 start_codon:yes stop_codon:yes gene_type:complete
MKNKIFTFIISVFVISFFYVLVGFWGIIEINKNKKFLFKNKVNLEFHKKYSEKIHHLRDANRWGFKRNEYLFSIINENEKKTILFQGDSWIESISEIKNSKNLLKKFGIDYKYNIYNAGITSFAPSLMHKQFEILKKDFNIIPNILIIYIDQTDIGDEFCRYKNNKVYSDDGRLVAIDRERFTRATYDYSKLYMYSELNFDSYVKKILKFPYKKTIYFIKRNNNQIKNIINNGYANRNKSKCGFKEIMRELANYNVKAENNFKESLKNYLKTLILENSIEKIFLVSFPHKGHLSNSYRVNVSSYIDDVINSKKDNRLVHLNMSKLEFDKLEVEKIYKKNDLASHLTDEYHTKLFMNNILSNLAKER